MITTNYAECKAYRNELLRQAKHGRLLKSAKRSQEKNLSLRQITQRIFQAQKQTVRGLEYDTL